MFSRIDEHVNHDGTPYVLMDSPIFQEMQAAPELIPWLFRIIASSVSPEFVVSIRRQILHVAYLIMSVD